MPSPDLPSPQALDRHGAGALSDVLLPDPLAPRTPDSRAQQPVWDIIHVALREAREGVRRTPGYDPNDWFWVLIAALDMVVAIRERDAGAPPDLWANVKQAAAEAKRVGENMYQNNITRATDANYSPRQMALAYADHYLQMRGDAFNFGPAARRELENAVVNYDLLKVRGLAFRTGRGAVSPPTTNSMFWGMKGIQDGFDDRDHHEARQHVALEVNEGGRFLFQAGLLALQALCHSSVSGYLHPPP
jgi:hypothetical protein